MNVEITPVVFRKWSVWLSWRVVILVVVLLLLPGASYALTNEQNALVGLKGMQVLVSQANPACDGLGLTKDQIKTDVELRLRKAGIQVLTVLNIHENLGLPFLSVDLQTIIGNGLCVYLIEIKLREHVILARGHNVLGAIWETSGLGASGTNNVQVIRGLISDVVDKFVNDYLAANPK